MATSVLSLKLRSETRAAHERVEAAPLLKSLFAPEFGMDAYRLLLQRWLEFFTFIEPHLQAVSGRYRYQSRVPSLETDLAALQERCGDPCHTPDVRCPDWFPHSAEEVLGSCYVIEGSCLGARVICRHLEERFGDRLEGACHFYSIESSSWRDFRRYLDEASEAAGMDGEKVIQGAKDCFKAITIHMN